MGSVPMSYRWRAKLFGVEAMLITIHPPTIGQEFHLRIRLAAANERAIKAEKMVKP